MNYDGLLTGAGGEWVFIGYAGGAGWYPFSGAATYHYNGVLDVSSTLAQARWVCGDLTFRIPLDG